MQFLIAFMIVYFMIAATLQRLFRRRQVLAVLERESLALSLTCLLSMFFPVFGIPVSNFRTGEVSVSGRLLYEAAAICMLFFLLASIIFLCRKYVCNRPNNSN